MEAGISSGDDTSEDEESHLDGFDTILKEDRGWSDIEATLQEPSLSIEHIHRYFIKRCLRKEQVTASKPFEKGYRIIAARKIHSMAIPNLSPSSLYCIIRAAVYQLKELVRRHTQWQ